MAITVTLGLLVTPTPACGGGRGSPRPTQQKPPTAASVALSPTATAQAAPTIPPQFAPLVAALLTAAAPEDLQPLLAFQDMECATTIPPMAAIPVCPAGTPGGTRVPVFPAIACEWVYPDLLERVLTATLARPRTLVAIYREEGPPYPGRVPRGEHAVITVGPEGFADAFQVAGGRIVGARFSCGGPAWRLYQGVEPARFLYGPILP